MTESAKQFPTDSSIDPNNDDSDNLDEILAKSIDFDQDSNSMDQKSMLAKGLILDDEREKLGRLIFSHNSTLRMRWDLFIILLALYNCVSIPFEVAFQTKFTDHWLLTIINYCIDICFFSDVVLNFRTTYINPRTGTEVTNWKKIFFHYMLGSRFCIDLLASVPFELFFSIFVSSSSSSFGLLGLLKLVRLLRLGRILTYMKFRSSLKVTMKIIQLLLFLLLLVHWIGCTWYTLVDEQDSWIPPKNLDEGKTDFYDIGKFK